MMNRSSNADNHADGGSPSLFDNWEAVGNRLRSAQDLLVCIDLDQALAPGIQSRSSAYISAATMELLYFLSHKAKVNVAIISGRALAKLKFQVGLESLIYAGNYGLEICGPGFQFTEPAANGRREWMRRISDTLRSRLKPVDGAEVENKGLTLSIHYASVDPACKQHLREIVGEVMSPVEALFRLFESEEAYEIRPRVDWHKETAVDWIYHAVAGENSLIIYAGDDAIDESDFRKSLHRIAIKIGGEMCQASKYSVADTNEVHELLERLIGCT
jgi:trehalose-phosphatase